MTRTPPPSHRPAPTPDGTHLARLQQRTEALQASTAPYRSEHRGAGDAARERIDVAVEALHPELVAFSHDLHAHPEEGYAEHRSVAALATLLEAHGVSPEVGVGGLDTALRARIGSDDGPAVAVVAEYDALPGIGHGCGHNVIAAAAAGAFLALHAVREELGLPGSVTLLGTPAEEGGGGKVHLLDAGVFDELDAALMVHPFSHDVADHPFLGRRELEVTFHGVASHASAQPFMGRNALDAATLTYQGIAMLRQHLPDSDRVHGVIGDGGARPNVVPEQTQSLYYVRSADPQTLQHLAERVEDIAVGAATMAGCGYTLRWDEAPAYLPLRHLNPLSARWSDAFAHRGRTVLPRGVVPESLTGSTDMGNVSQQVPGMHPMVAIAPPGTAMHTVDFAAAAAAPAADATIADAAAALATVAADVLLDDELRAAVHTAFAAQA